MLTRRSYMSRPAFVERPAEKGSRKWLIAELDKLTSIIVRWRDRSSSCAWRTTWRCEPAPAVQTALKASAGAEGTG